MTGLGALIKRDTKLFFKDKGMFFTSLITPIILLVLYVTFLKNVYMDSFQMNLPEGMTIDDKLLSGFVGGQLVASLLAVCCVTVAFCANTLMVQDKVTGSRTDLTITPVKKSTLSLAYYVSTVAATLIVCFVALGASLVYLAITGWYLTVTDVLLMCLDVFLLGLFGTALSSVINSFLTTQGQISGVGAIISAGYGFICGAYMPISQFSDGLQKALSYLPGTYGTSLIKNHAMAGPCQELSDVGFPDEVIDNMRDSVDCNVYFGGDLVETETMYIILTTSVVLLVAIYVIIGMIRKKA